MENELKPGDIVVLKSGGPAMTVDWIDEYKYASCSWFDGKKPVSQKFPITSLRLEE